LLLKEQWRKRFTIARYSYQIQHLSTTASNLIIHYFFILIQVTKLSLSCRVVDEQQIERHFTSAELDELYTFEPDNHQNRPTPTVPEDRLLAELLIQQKEWIVTYHEHDSLLKNQLNEELTEAERKAAWDDFENEMRGAPNVTTPAHPFNFILERLKGRSVAGISLSSIAATMLDSNPGITQDDFLGRFRSEVCTKFNTFLISHLIVSLCAM